MHKEGDEEEERERKRGRREERHKKIIQTLLLKKKTQCLLIKYHKMVGRGERERGVHCSCYNNLLLSSECCPLLPTTAGQTATCCLLSIAVGETTACCPLLLAAAVVCGRRKE